jgi:hypothetical protein
VITAAAFWRAREEQAIARFVTARGVTRCPTVAVEATTATIPQSDREVLARRPAPDWSIPWHTQIRVERDNAKEANREKIGLCSGHASDGEKCTSVGLVKHRSGKAYCWAHLPT